MGEPVALETAWHWLEANAPRLGVEEVSLAAAHGRVPATAMVASPDVPATSCAAEDGYALQDQATVGAAPYSPLSCSIAEVGVGCVAVRHGRSGRSRAAVAGRSQCRSAARRRGGGGRRSDRRAGGRGRGAGVMMSACELCAGEPLWPAGRRRPLRAAEIGLLSAAGIARVPVVRRPRTRILIAGGASAPQVLGPMPSGSPSAGRRTACWSTASRRARSIPR
jgi:molybdopterin biosynthesis enzyme